MEHLIQWVRELVVCEKVRRVKWWVSWEAGLKFQATGKDLSVLCWTVLLYCYETWGLTVADETRLLGVERRMIRMMCGVRLADRVSTDVLRYMVGIIMKIKDMIIQISLWWYGHIIHQDITLTYVRLWSLK